MASMSPVSTRRIRLPLATLALSIAGRAAALPFAARPVHAAPPPQLAPAIARLLDAEAVEVTAGPGTLATFWLRRELPTAKPDAPERSPVLEDRIAVKGIVAGTLVGVAALDEPWRDYRNRAVVPGLYTLRYLLQPAIKDHRGVSRYRDFLVLTPAALDREDDLDPRSVITASAAASGRGHPVVMAVFPAAPGPLRIVENELRQRMLAVRTGDVTMGLVLESHGSIEDEEP